MWIIKYSVKKYCENYPNITTAFQNNLQNFLSGSQIAALFSCP